MPLQSTGIGLFAYLSRSKALDIWIFADLAQLMYAVVIVGSGRRGQGEGRCLDKLGKKKE